MNGVIFALDQIGQLAQAQAMQIEELTARNEALERKSSDKLAEANQRIVELEKRLAGASPDEAGK